MRLAFAAIALLSCTGLAVAAEHKSDSSDAPKAPEQGAVLHNPAPAGAPRSGWAPHPMTGMPDLQGGASRANVPQPAFQPASPPLQPGALQTGARGGRGDGGVTRGHHQAGGGYGRPSRGGGSYGGRHRGYGGGMVVFPYPGTWWPYPPYYGTYGTYSDDEANDGDDATGAPPSGETPPDETPPVFWYYCDQPDGYYPYVKSCSHDWSTIPISPPPPGATVPLSYSDWQWCEESKSFFPYVPSCKSGFVAVPVTAPKSDSAPAIANWFFCEDPRGYLPYVIQCKKDWRAVPSVPPPSVKITVKDAPERK